MTHKKRRTGKGSTDRKHKRTIYAAGGVLWRSDDSGTVEVGLVHRPRYDDWSLPKGKTEAGETFLHTAAREIGEETGYSVRIGRHLSRVRYRTDSSTTKYVHYWSAEAIAGDFAENHEVDKLVWLDPATAMTTVSYREDAAVLAEFTRLPIDLKTLLIIRHAKAGQKAKYRGDDRLRPLDKVGKRQAQALVPQCLVFGAQHVHSADRVRCEQTVGPLAETLGVPILSEPTLSEEAYHDDPDAAHQQMLSIAAMPGIRAVCSQGKVIPPLLDWWTGRDRVELPVGATRKASMWVLSLDEDSRIRGLDYIDSPLAH